MFTIATGIDRRSFRRIMLTSVSAIAIAVSIAREPARAEERETTVIIDFNYAFLMGDSQVWAEAQGPLGSSLRIRPDARPTGTLGLVTPLTGTPYDIGVFASFGVSDTERRSAINPTNVLGGLTYASYSAGVGRAKHSEKHLIVDFEARRDIGLGSESGLDVTAKAGIRFGYFDAETGTTFSTPGLYLLNEDRDSRFIGAGPMLGFDARAPLGDSFQLDFSAAAALLLGDQQTRVVTNQPLGGIIVGNTRGNDHRFDVVPMVEASAALGFAVPGTAATLSMGVRFEAWFGVYDQETSFDPFNLGGTLGKKNANRYSLGPFIRLEIPLGQL